MHVVKKKLCFRAFGGIQVLQSFARRTIVQRDFTGSSGAALVKESKRTACATKGFGVSGAESKYYGASLWVGRLDTRIRKPKLESLVRIEGLQIAGLRLMGITTRPSDRDAEHGVRDPLPNADGSPGRTNEQRQDGSLGGSKRVAASQGHQVEEAVGVHGGPPFEVNEAERRKALRMSSANMVHETEGEFTNRSESHSTGSQPSAEVNFDGNLSDGIDEEVQRGLIADSEHPVGRVAVEDDPNYSSFGDEEGLIIGGLSDGDLSQKEAEKDRTDRVH